MGVPAMKLRPCIYIGRIEANIGWDNASYRDEAIVTITNHTSCKINFGGLTKTVCLSRVRSWEYL